jgi:antitoxin HigA-1
MTVEVFADHIGTSRQTVHAIIAGRSAVGAEMAVRLGRAFNVTPQFWLNMQTNYDVWELDRALAGAAAHPPAQGAQGAGTNS